MPPDSNQKNSLDPTQNPDAQEALSRALGNRTIMILPLSSGRFALLDRGFQLHSIVDSLPSAEELRVLSTTFQTKLALQRAKISASVEMTAHPPKTGIILHSISVTL